MSHPDGEVSKNPPRVFHPRQPPPPTPTRKRATDPGKTKGAEENAYKFKTRLAGVGKESREPLKLSPISPLEPGTVAEGPRFQDFFKLCTPAALRRDSLQGAWVHTHTSLLTHGPAVRAPQTSGGGLILNCLRCPFFPQGYCVKSRDVQSRGCSSKGQVTQAPSSSGYAHPC